MLVLSLVVILLAVLVGLLLLGMAGGEEDLSIENSVSAGTESAAETGSPKAPEVAPRTQASVNLGYGLSVTDTGNYTGMYMEDGSDEIVSGVLMLVVKNTGAQDIQYAEITMVVGEETASFKLSTLPVGESAVLLETGRMQWLEDVDYASILPRIENIAYFQEPVSTHEDKLKIGIVDGAINVTNISGEDIAGDIAVYYKNAAADLYYGGITYRIAIEGGLKADEIRQVMTNHASDTGSRILFVTIAQ